MLNKIVEETQLHKTTDGDINFQAVTRQVIKSQPPRIGDVADMVSYVRFWGGLPSGVFIKDLSQLCLSMPSDRIVAGSFFKWLADLQVQFPTNSLPSHFINAMLYVHAQAKENVQDGIARYIQKAEVAQIANKSKRDIVYEADGILLRFRKLVDTMKQNDKIDVISSLKIDVVMCVIARKNREDQRTLHQIAADYAKRVCDLQGIAAEVMEPSASPAAVGEQTSTRANNAIFYNEEGEAQDVGRVTVMNKGFKPGMHVMKLKGQKTTQWKIKTIHENGAVDLSAVCIDGTITTETYSQVQLDSFLEGYREVAKTKIFEFYPAADPANGCSDLDVIVWKGKVAECIGKLMQDNMPSSAFIMIEPEKKVIAGKDYGVDEFVLVPSTLNIGVEPITSKKTCPSKSVECTCDDLKFKAFLHPMGNTETFTSLFWNMRSSSKVEDTNMMLKTVSYRFKAPTAAARNMSVESTMKMQIAVNNKPIRKHDEIIIYRVGDDEKGTKRSQAALITPKQAKANKTNTKA